MPVGILRAGAQGSLRAALITSSNRTLRTGGIGCETLFGLFLFNHPQERQMASLPHSQICDIGVKVATKSGDSGKLRKTCHASPQP